jgi:DNA-binding CsgD family transcriptional regulator
VSSDILPASERRANRYYHDILEPRGFTDAILVGLARERQLIGYLGLNRHVSDGPIGSEEIAGVRLIAPHLRRAITIGDLFDLKSVASDTFRSVLDGMASAVVLVDDDLRIVHANPVAETMLASGNLMENAKGRLMVRGRFAEEALRAAARIAAENETRLSQRGIGIPATARDGSAALLHVLPLARRDGRSRLGQGAVAAVFAVPAGSDHTPIDAIATLYDLTPTESQIFASLCRGRSLATTAGSLGIAKSTARTHLLRVFAKTGCSRQAELVALAARLSLNI